MSSTSQPDTTNTLARNQYRMALGRRGDGGLDRDLNTSVWATMVGGLLNVDSFLDLEVIGTSHVGNHHIMTAVTWDSKLIALPMPENWEPA